MSKKCLIVVDYQVDFVSGSLGFSGAETLDERIAEKIDKYRSTGGKIIFTKDTHNDNYLDSFEGKHLPVAHCIRGSAGHEIYGKTAKKISKTDLIIEKPTFGCAKLFEILQDEQFNIIELCGLMSNICVLSNAVIAKAALPEAEIIIDSACTGGFDEKLNKEALDIMRGLQMTVL